MIGVTTYWVIHNWGDVDPQLHGPYMSQEEQTNRADLILEEDDEGAVMLLDIVDGRPTVEIYGPDAP